MVGDITIARVALIMKTNVDIELDDILSIKIEDLTIEA